MGVVGTGAGRLACGLLLGAALLLAPLPCRAIGDWEKGDLSLELTGVVRVTGAFLHYTGDVAEVTGGDDGLAAGVLRLIGSGGLHERVDYEVNLFLDLNRAPALPTGSGAFPTPGSTRSPYRNRYLAWDFWDSGNVAGQLGVDRLGVELDLEPVKLSLGRFPVNHSVTLLFVPNDFFAAFSPTAINKIYKPGVDALRLSYSPAPMTTLELDAVMGSDDDGVPSWRRTALLARVATVRWAIEWALLGGKLAERYVVGGSLQGEAGPFGVRLEGHAVFPDGQDQPGSPGSEREVAGRVAAGADLRWAWRNANLGFEALYKSDGANRPALYRDQVDRLYPDDLLFLGQLYMGLSAGLDLLPILRLTGLVLMNASDFSGLGQVFVLYNIADEADFVGGVMLPWGASYDSSRPGVLQSELGSSPITAFLELRFFY